MYAVPLHIQYDGLDCMIFIIRTNDAAGRVTYISNLPTGLSAVYFLVCLSLCKIDKRGEVFAFSHLHINHPPMLFQLHGVSPVRVHSGTMNPETHDSRVGTGACPLSELIHGTPFSTSERGQNEREVMSDSSEDEFTVGVM